MESASIQEEDELPLIWESRPYTFAELIERASMKRKSIVYLKYVRYYNDY